MKRKYPNRRSIYANGKDYNAAYIIPSEKSYPNRIVYEDVRLIICIYSNIWNEILLN
jgi:hypothetical protein